MRVASFARVIASLVFLGSFFYAGGGRRFPLVYLSIFPAPLFFLEKVKSVLFGSFYPLILLRLEHQIDS